MVRWGVIKQNYAFCHGSPGVTFKSLSPHPCFIDIATNIMLGDEGGQSPLMRRKKKKEKIIIM